MSDPANPTNPTNPVESPSPTESAQPSARANRGARHAWELEQARRRAVRDIVEQRIEEAREEGKFNNLRGSGKPLHIDDNVWAGDRALAYHILQSNDVAPQELERGHEIDREIDRAEEPIRALRHRRDTLATRQRVFPSDRRAYNIQRESVARHYAEALRAINSKILSLNIIAPAALHRRLINVEARLEAFHAEFPALPET